MPSKHKIGSRMRCLLPILENKIPQKLTLRATGDSESVVLILTVGFIFSATHTVDYDHWFAQWLSVDLMPNMRQSITCVNEQQFYDAIERYQVIKRLTR